LVIVLVIIVVIVVVVRIVITVVVTESVGTRIKEIGIVIITWIIAIHPRIAPAIREEGIVERHIVAVIGRKRTVETAHVTKARIDVRHTHRPAVEHIVRDTWYYGWAVSIVKIAS
jgi:hypothetical protein